LSRKRKVHVRCLKKAAISWCRVDPRCKTHVL